MAPKLCNHKSVSISCLIHIDFVSGGAGWPFAMIQDLAGPCLIIYLLAGMESLFTESLMDDRGGF
jgi:hypothetical protein